ncbi:unnamed protein product [Ceutorhynchus assimilis]|uniref:Tesmin/TSO1-like CXC domain-containing protein n=1 Tax=Ceutorhynchus assimilis TaxID=467358 RepID=A0A9N9QKW7_9CUCU|nr:unnamed protein product [Ceutorhynchus assimilis]
MTDDQLTKITKNLEPGYLSNQGYTVVYSTDGKGTKAFRYQPQDHKHSGELVPQALVSTILINDKEKQGESDVATCSLRNAQEDEGPLGGIEDVELANLISFFRNIDKLDVFRSTLAVIKNDNSFKDKNATDMFCGVSAETSNQHVELRESRQMRDKADVSKMVNWLQSHHPFNYSTNHPVSTGLVADDTVNCDEALLHASITATIKDSVVEINPNQLFHPLLCVVRDDDDLKKYLRNELAAKPPSLFDWTLMRRGTKSGSIDVLEEIAPPVNNFSVNTELTVDGGFLLHRFVWACPANVSKICLQYMTYVENHFGQNATMVFDGYESPSTKDEEHTKLSGVSDSERFLLALYGCGDERNLNNVRYRFYQRIGTKQSVTTTFDVATLPPTSAAAKQHLYRVYHQGNRLPEAEWGWISHAGQLKPIPTTKEPAPERVLNIISCNCKSGCDNRCGCRRNGLNCTNMCGYCAGHGCTNRMDYADLDIDDDVEPLADVLIK